MRRILLIVVSLLALLIVAPVASAATTKGVSIKRSSFSPATVNIVAGDTIRWKNNDTHNHQVVSTTGTFASPVLVPGRTYSFRFDVAGTYKYRDALVPTSIGTIKVAGAPPAVTLGTSLPQITYGTRITLSGQINSRKAGENVQLNYLPYGQGSEAVLATVISGADGIFTYNVTPKILTTYRATWKNASSLPVPDPDRSVDHVRPAQRLPDPRLRWAEHGGKAGAAAAVLEPRAMGDDQARHPRRELRASVSRQSSQPERTGCGSRCRSTRPVRVPRRLQWEIVYRHHANLPRFDRAGAEQRLRSFSARRWRCGARVDSA